MEFEPHLIEYLRSIYINCSLCAQKCIRPFTVDEKPSPALKNPSVWRRYVLWDDVLWEDGLWSHGKLWFWISGWEEKEQNVTEESRWCEQRGMQTALIVPESRECLFSKHILHLDLAAGIFGEVTLKAHVSVLEVVLAWDGTVMGWRVGYVVRVWFCQLGEENLRWLWQETGATESPEQQLRRRVGVWERVA